MAAIQGNNAHDQGTQRVLRALLHERIELNRINFSRVLIF